MAAPIVRAITVQQPYASAFFLPESPKNIENRTFSIEHPTILAIVAGKLTAPAAPAHAQPAAGVELPHGLILGVVWLTEIHEQFDANCRCVPENVGGWALSNPLSAPRPMKHWCVGRPRPVPAGLRFPYTGFQGVRTLGAPVTEALLRAVS